MEIIAGTQIDNLHHLDVFEALGFRMDKDQAFSFCFVFL